MSQYPKHPRPVVTKADQAVAALVAKACAEDAQRMDAKLSYGRTPSHLRLQDVFTFAYGGPIHSWRQVAYVLGLCEWEMGRANRRPSSAGLSTPSKKEAKIRELADQAQRFLGHWLALVDAMVAAGVSERKGGQDPFGEWPIPAIEAANSAPLADGRTLTQGGKDFNKRPPELVPELEANFDDELALALKDACEAQRHRKICDGRSVEDCLYFELPDVVSHLLAQPYVSCEYVLERMHWLCGERSRRPQWGTRDKAEDMRELDELALRLSQHWLALHEALDGEIDAARAKEYLFERGCRLLLTDVESLSDRVELERVREIRGISREIRPRQRLSALSA